MVKNRYGVNSCRVRINWHTRCRARHARARWCYPGTGDTSSNRSDRAIFSVQWYLFLAGLVSARVTPPLFGTKSGLLTARLILENQTNLGGTAGGRAEFFSNVNRRIGCPVQPSSMTITQRGVWLVELGMEFSPITGMRYSPLRRRVVLLTMSNSSMGRG